MGGLRLFVTWGRFKSKEKRTRSGGVRASFLSGKYAEFVDASPSVTSKLVVQQFIIKFLVLKVKNAKDEEKKVSRPLSSVPAPSQSLPRACHELPVLSYVQYYV